MISFLGMLTMQVGILVLATTFIVSIHIDYIIFYFPAVTHQMDTAGSINT